MSKIIYFGLALLLYNTPWIRNTERTGQQELHHVTVTCHASVHTWPGVSSGHMLTVTSTWSQTQAQGGGHSAAAATLVSQLMVHWQGDTQQPGTEILYFRFTKFSILIKSRTFSFGHPSSGSHFMIK